ncbi:hypothetical protein ACI2OX_08685 [Bacillus sp. N9]
MAGSTINGSLYAEDANIKLENNGVFSGNIFTGGTSVIIRNGQTKGASLILAPNAKVKHDQGTIMGTIIAHSYEIMSGNAKLNYKKSNLLKVQFQPEVMETTMKAEHLNLKKELCMNSNRIANEC